MFRALYAHHQEAELYWSSIWYRPLSQWPFSVHVQVERELRGQQNIKKNFECQMNLNHPVHIIIQVGTKLSQNEQVVRKCLSMGIFHLKETLNALKTYTRKQ